MSAEGRKDQHFIRGLSEAFLDRPAAVIAKRVSADLITGAGLVLGILGESLICDPKASIQKLKAVTGLDITEDTVKKIGVVAIGVSLVCDWLDGAVARKRGPTKHGKVFDSTVDRIVDNLPAVLFLQQTENPKDREIWSNYLLVSSLPSLVRSVAARNGVKVSEIDVGSRLARTPVLIASILLEQKRPLLGKVLIFQSLASSLWRYMKVQREGSNTAIQAVDQSLFGYLAAHTIAKSIASSEIDEGSLSLGVILATTTKAKVEEVYSTG